MKLNLKESFNNRVLINDPEFKRFYKIFDNSNNQMYIDRIKDKFYHIVLTLTERHDEDLQIINSNIGYKLCRFIEPNTLEFNIKVLLRIIYDWGEHYDNGMYYQSVDNTCKEFIILYDCILSEIKKYMEYHIIDDIDEMVRKNKYQYSSDIKEIMETYFNMWED